MDRFLDLDAFPLSNPESEAYGALVARCLDDLERNGMCNLVGFLRPEVAVDIAGTLAGPFATDGFRHARRHNIYFRAMPELEAGHPALREFETRNLTLPADRLTDTPLMAIYDWPPFQRFLAEIMGKPAVYAMDDPLARVNVMSYSADDQLSWHFDRSEFTTTLLLQAPEAGGAFEYRTDLRSEDDPNYDGVATLLAGEDPEIRQITLAPGTLNVFKGRNTPHRVIPVEGETPRVIAVFSYFEEPGKVFSKEEQVAFYGRAADLT